MYSLAAKQHVSAAPLACIAYGIGTASPASLVTHVYKQSCFAGMSESTVFVARMLQSLKIKADIFNREECKGMWRGLVDTGHSKAHRKAIGGYLTSLMSQVVGGVAKDRGLEAYQVHLSHPICFMSLLTHSKLSQSADLVLALLS